MAHGWAPPTRPVDDLTPYLKKIYSVAGEVATREVVGQALEMAPKGGGFASLVSAMQVYGLVETGGGQIKVTELGKRVAFETDPTELNQVKAEAVSNVPLFKDYYTQYGNDTGEEKVKVFLRKAGVEVPQLPKLAEWIGKLLKDNLPYMVGVHVGGGLVGSLSPAPPPQTGGARENVIPINDSLIEFRMGTYLMRFPMDDAETAKTVISALLDKKSKSLQSGSAGNPGEGNE